MSTIFERYHCNWNFSILWTTCYRKWVSKIIGWFLQINQLQCWLRNSNRKNCTLEVLRLAIQSVRNGSLVNNASKSWYFWKMNMLECNTFYMRCNFMKTVLLLLTPAKTEFFKKEKKVHANYYFIFEICYFLLLVLQFYLYGVAISLLQHWPTHPI